MSGAPFAAAGAGSCPPTTLADCQDPAYLRTACGLEAFELQIADPNWVCNTQCTAAVPSDCNTAAAYDDYKRTLCGRIDAARPTSNFPAKVEDPSWPCFAQAEAYRNALPSDTVLLPEAIAAQRGAAHPVATETSALMEPALTSTQDEFELPFYDPFFLSPKPQPESLQYQYNDESFDTCREYAYKKTWDLSHFVERYSDDPLSNLADAVDEYFSQWSNGVSNPGNYTQFRDNLKPTGRIIVPTRPVTPDRIHDCP